MTLFGYGQHWESFIPLKLYLLFPIKKLIRKQLDIWRKEWKFSHYLSMIFCHFQSLSIQNMLKHFYPSKVINFKNSRNKLTTEIPMSPSLRLKLKAGKSKLVYQRKYSSIQKGCRIGSKTPNTIWSNSRETANISKQTPFNRSILSMKWVIISPIFIKPP